MVESLIDFSIKQCKKQNIDYADIWAEETEGNYFLMKNGVTQASSFDTSNGISLRVFIKNKMAFISTDILEEENIRNMIKNASEMLKAGNRLCHDVNLTEEKPNKKEYEVKPKLDPRAVETKDKVKILKDIEKALTSVKTKAIGRYISLSDNHTKNIYANTNGSFIKSTIPRVNIFYYITVQENNETAQRYNQYGASKGYEAFTEWNLPKALAEETEEVGKNISEGKKLPSGTYDFVVDSEVVGIMVHESVGHPYEGDRIIGREAAQAGESFVNPKMMNEQIGNDIVNVSDDPTIPNSNGFYLYDDEGVKAKKRQLMKNGKINEFLLDRNAAKVLNMQSNGSARQSSYDREPLVRMANTFLEPGDHKDDELIKDIKNGILMKNFTEWNIDDKRLNQKYVGLECWRIEKGKITGRVKQPAIEISTPQLWQSVDAVGKTIKYTAGTCGKGEPMQGIPVWFGGPSMRLRNIRIT